MYGKAITYGVVSLLLLGGFAYITFKITSKNRSFIFLPWLYNLLSKRG